MGLELNSLKTKWNELIAAKNKYKAKLITYSEYKRRKAVIELKYAPEETIYAKETAVRLETTRELKVILEKPEAQLKLKELVTNTIPKKTLKVNPASTLISSIKNTTVETFIQDINKPPNYIIYIIVGVIGLYLFKKA